MKKYLAFILSLAIGISMLIIPENTANAKTESVQLEASSMQKLMDLGIFTETDADRMNLDQTISREEFAVILVQVNGQQDNLALYRNSSSFSDVPATRWSSPYIQCAVKMGYMTEMPDGKFHPTDKISFSLVAAVFGKLLGYSNANLPGSYPYNYLTHLGNIGILDGISWTASGTVTRGQMAVMILRLFSAKVFGEEKAFVETISNYKRAIILENGVTSKDGDERRIMTDKGTFYLNEGKAPLELGKRYILRLDGKVIQNASLDNLEYREFSAKSYISGKIISNDNKTESIPSGIPYYYQGKEVEFKDISNVIKTNSSIIIGYDGNEAVFGSLFDPIYSDYQIATAQSANIYKSYLVEKNGKFIDSEEIEKDDVICYVTDIWQNNKYIIVSDNTVTGEVTAILPNKASPVSIKINNTVYSLDPGFPFRKISTIGNIKVGETATAVIGPEGSIIDIIGDTAEGTDNYALVLNAYTRNSDKISEPDKKYHYVTLLHSNGHKKTYMTDSLMSLLKGKIVTYQVTAKGKDYDTVKIAEAAGSINGEFKINKDERTINDIYVANGAVLFNIISTSSEAIEASVISFSDLPSGTLAYGKVKYLHTSGDFSDIDIMLFDNVLEENIEYGLIVGKKGSVSLFGSENIFCELTILVNGQKLTYTCVDAGYNIYTVVKLVVKNNTIESILYKLSPEVSDSKIEAVDTNRIKMRGKVYTFNKKLTIYRQNYTLLDWTKLKTSDLDKNNRYGTVSIFTDPYTSYSGKVVLILIWY